MLKEKREKESIKMERLHAFVCVCARKPWFLCSLVKIGAAKNRSTPEKENVFGSLAEKQENIFVLFFFMNSHRICLFLVFPVMDAPMLA